MPKPLFKLIIVCVCFATMQGKAQNTPSVPTSTTEPVVTSDKKYVRKFKSITDSYYGFPNIYAIIFRPLATLKGATGVEVKSIGPTGIKYEFMITDKFGIGTDINYSLISVSFTKPKGDSTNTSYSYKVSSPAFRSMLAFSFHKSKKKKLDWYSSIKIGYYNRSIKIESTDPGFKAPSLDWPLPIAFRLEGGFRYFPTRFTGIHFNMGILGSALFNAGVSQVF